MARHAKVTLLGGILPVEPTAAVPAIVSGGRVQLGKGTGADDIDGTQISKNKRKSPELAV